MDPFAGSFAGTGGAGSPPTRSVTVSGAPPLGAVCGHDRELTAAGRDDRDSLSPMPAHRPFQRSRVARMGLPRAGLLLSRTGARRLAVALASVAGLLGTGLVAESAGDLQNQISAAQSQASSLQSQIAAQSSAIAHTNGGIAAARMQLAGLQTQLDSRIDELRTVQTNLMNAAVHLQQLEARLKLSSAALANNLRAEYEGGQPNLMTVILQARGFSSLLSQVDFMQRVGRQDAQIVGSTKSARIDVLHQTIELGKLEERDRTLTDDVLSQRNQVAALQAALVTQQISEVSKRETDRSQLSSVNASISTLRSKLAAIEARAAAQARETAAEVNQSVGGIAIDTTGMVQPPAGAPAAVGEMIAAGNAIATLPYIWGGGHGSFQAAGYDCSGSVSYVLAAAGLLSAPEVSGDFESYGDPGPGQWVTIYANAGHVWMEIAGWRYDTVALAEDGTRWSQGGGEFAGFVVRHPPGL
jgi:peptidoglycan hydrolase CwlO-like protein